MDNNFSDNTINNDNSVVNDLKRYDEVEALIDEYMVKKAEKQSLEINVTGVENKRYVEVSLRNLYDSNREAKTFAFEDNFDKDILPRLAFKYCNDFDTDKHYLFPYGDNGYYANISTTGDCFRLYNINIDSISEMQDIIKLDDENKKNPTTVGDNKTLMIVEAILIALITFIIGILVLYILFHFSK